MDKKIGIAIAGIGIAVVIGVIVAVMLAQPSVQLKNRFFIGAHYKHDLMVGEKGFFYGAARSGEPPYQYEWDFGDGSKSFLQNATHSYASPGDYEIKLYVTDDTGSRQGESFTVQVLPVSENATSSQKPEQ